MSSEGVTGVSGSEGSQGQGVTGSPAASVLCFQVELLNGGGAVWRITCSTPEGAVVTTARAVEALSDLHRLIAQATRGGLWR